MQAIGGRKKNSLRLVRSTANGELKIGQSLIDSHEYYKQVEQYAHQIREADSADEIIDILDIVLSETKGLQFSDEVCAAKEQVKIAECKIELMKRELEQLKASVQIDQMTGALNRCGLDEVFCREAARADRYAQSLCIVLVDFDDFKQVNKKFGRQFGDDVLIKLISVAKDTLRPSDIVARLDDEEFFILLSDLEMDEAISVMHRLQKNLSKVSWMQGNSQDFPITFSAGVAIRSFGEHQDSVTNRASQALCQAKRAGKNRIVPTI